MEIFDALKCWITWLAKTMFHYTVEAVEVVLEVLAFTANAILAVLPAVALPDPELDGGAIGLLNAFVPLDLFVVVGTTIMTAWVIYRLYLWAMRWAKAEE